MKTARCYSALTGSISKLSTQASDTPKSLEEVYDNLLKQLISSHFRVFVELIEIAEREVGISHADSAINLLAGIENDDHQVSDLIRRLGRLQNLHYYNVRTSRRQFERYMTPVSDYHAFLKELYPENLVINHEKLFEAYQQLPGPRPLHVTSQHLEDFLAVFMDSDALASRAIYTTLIDEIVDCGMPISVHEYNACLSRAINIYLRERRDDKSGGLSMEKITKYQNAVIDTKHRDSSTLNILLGFARKTNRVKKFMADSWPDFAQSGVRLDRLTMILHMLHAGEEKDADLVRQVYQKMCSSGYVIDVSVINTLIKTMLQCNNLDEAQNIFDFVTGQGIKPMQQLSNPFSRIPANVVLMKQLKLVDAAVQLLHSSNLTVDPQTLRVPVLPDVQTFGLMITHHCLVTRDFNRAFDLMSIQADFGLLPTSHHFKAFYDGFHKNNLHNASWNRKSLNKVTSLLCAQYEKYSTNSLTGASKINATPASHLFHPSLLQKAFKAYYAIFWDQKEAIGALQNEANPTADSTNDADNPAPKIRQPTKQTVYRALQQLMNLDKHHEDS